MRAAPAVGSSGTFALTNAIQTNLAVSIIAIDQMAPYVSSINVTCASGLVAGNITQFTANNNLDARLTFDAEL
jgi:hypothetical protein